MTAPEPQLSISEPVTPSFSDDCKQVLHGLRGALTTALSAVSVDPARPQEVARRLGLHRNLTWKISKIVTATNVFASVSHVPGRTGMEILMAALRKAGAPERDVSRIGAAMVGFDRLVKQHSGDRATLDLVAGGFVPDAAQRESLAQARRLAFRGNSAIWSVQARVLMAIKILAPSTQDPERVDMVQVNGMIDVRRLRSDVAWPLFRHQSWDAEGVFGHAGTPLEPDCDPTGVPLLRGFSSPELPEIRVIRGDQETEYELPEGAVGRVGELTVVYGVYLPSIGPQMASEGDTVCELGCNMRTPVELMHSDLLVHDSLKWAMNPRAEIYSLLEGREVHGPDRRACSLLEGDCEVHELGRGIATMATPHIPRYSDLLEHIFACVGWDESAFHGFRHTVNYPPIPATSLLSMDLETEG